MIYTLRFEVPQLRPDVARFDGEAACKDAIRHMIHTRYKGKPLRIRVRDQYGRDVYNFERQ